MKTRNEIPIVFSFNDKYTLPAGVCLSSLLSNAHDNTYYQIFILHSSSRLSEQNKNRIRKLTDRYDNFSIHFIDLKNKFNSEYEVRNVSIETYYRLLIPELLPQFDKVIYCDVDICFNGDLNSLYDISINQKSIGAVMNFFSYLPKDFLSHAKKIGVQSNKYFNAGVLIINSKKIRLENTIDKKIKPLLGRKFKYQDQDILNIVFQYDVEYISPIYNFTIFGDIRLLKNKCPKVYHFLLEKPWDSLVAFSDVWWSSYRNSIFYDKEYYHDFQRNQHSRSVKLKKIENFLKRLFVWQKYKR